MGVIEGYPHNFIHNWVGGTMSRFLSPIDPIFWTHHCMVDALWVDWNIDRGYPNTNDPDWVNTTFDEFVDGTGSPVSVNVGATVLLPLIGYTYDFSSY